MESFLKTQASARSLKEIAAEVPDREAMFFFNNAGGDLQGWAKEWALCCVNHASWLPLAAGGEFAQPLSHIYVHCVRPFFML